MAPFVVSDGVVMPTQLKRYCIDVCDFVVSNPVGTGDEFVGIGFQTSLVLPPRRDSELQAHKLLRSFVLTHSQCPCCGCGASGVGRARAAIAAVLSIHKCEVEWNTC